MDYLNLSGKHILVTGASSGIGRETALQLSKIGAKVSMLDRNAERLSDTLSQAVGQGHHAYEVDLADIESLEEKVKRIIQEAGPFDGFVQCAGITEDLPFGNYKYARLHNIMTVNFYSFFELVRVMTKKGRYHEGMSIVALSSSTANCGTIAQSAYGASKAAMNGAMRCMARELAPKGIRVNTILPGPTNTEMYRAHLELKGNLEQEPGAKKVGRNYLGMNEPVDVANAVIFLLSPASRMITGIELPVDGGFTSC
ncbi:MAG: SDR family oxidoreductase [Clostridia bacterium]|nr:SDR family oxidoreductase [Clostridia bacterium]